MEENLNNSTANSRALLCILAKQRPGLKICHINAQSLPKKIEEFRYMFVNSEIDVICVSETWFVQSLCDVLISCDGYNVYRSDRVSHGGGVAIYVNKKLKAKIICQHTINSAIEYIFLEIQNPIIEKNLLIGCIYRPHCNTNYDDLINILTDITVNFTGVILAGDLNSDILRESHLTSNMESLGLKPVNLSFPTHFSRKEYIIKFDFCE